jgi:hypothetical protein
MLKAKIKAAVALHKAAGTAVEPRENHAAQHDRTTNTSATALDIKGSICPLSKNISSRGGRKTSVSMERVG